jgi:(1->4)-alpha-D-glucan 1-alpha-D-glucosylmutase
LKTRPGSTHGYDVTDHSQLNPELGDPADYETLCARLAEHGLGQIVDIVPNHVGIMGSEGRWWLDVLENGQASQYAEYFDIDWQPVTAKLSNKVLVPVLGDQYGNVLSAGDLTLGFEPATGELGVTYFEHRFPLDPWTYPALLETRLDTLEPQSPAERTDLIELESIARSLTSLPHHSSTGSVHREVRAHEAIVAKRRLKELFARSRFVAEHIERNVAAFNGTPGNRDSFERLHALLERQPYRLAYWRVAADEINYRRFFDINDLAGLRTQNVAVLEATHRRLLEWAAEGKIHGFRIDHPDGLYDPRGYLEWLRAELAAIGRQEHYLVVEKILAAHEHLPRGWPVHGTTGYDFGFAVNGLLVHGPSEREFERVYRAFIGEQRPYDAIVYQCKQQILTFHLSSELTVLANLLNRIAEMRLETRDFTLNALRGTLLELVVAFPVYRSYVTAEHIGEQDRQHIDWAVSSARQSYEEHDEGILDFVRKLLLDELPADADAPYRRQVALFVAKFQQLTAPVMAKALEDTCFYRFVSLLSVNEVGSDPRRFSVTPAAFHRLAELRLQHWPHTMLGTSTHDSKRSEDVRARLNVLSEMPDEWRARLLKWRRINASRRRRLAVRSVPSRNEEYLLYQTLVGSWPAGNRAAEMDEYRERIAAYMTKALREAKVHTSWSRPNADYEERVLGFVADVLSETQRNPFVEDLDELVTRIALPGFLNSLSQTLLKLTSPGVPDVYQGNELWAFSLVDPDNRRPVDYARRRTLLDELAREASDVERVPEAVDTLFDDVHDGRAKLFLTWRALTLRAEHAPVFEKGGYGALEAGGAKAEHVCAFARHLDGVTIVVVAGRWFMGLLPAAGRWPESPLDWGDTRVALPPGTYTSVLDGRSLPVHDGRVRAGELFSRYPAALLVATSARAQ